MLQGAEQSAPFLLNFEVENQFSALLQYWKLDIQHSILIFCIFPTSFKTNVTNIFLFSLR
jgi:hypothetical protein